MKAAVLICRKRDGELVSVVEDTIVDLLALAKATRVSGELDGDSIDRGVVLSSWHSGPAYRFRCAAPVAKAKANAKGKGKAK